MKKTSLILLCLFSANVFGMESEGSFHQVMRSFHNNADSTNKNDYSKKQTEENKQEDFKVDYDIKGYGQEDKFPQIDEKKPSSFEKQEIKTERR